MKTKVKYKQMVKRVKNKWLKALRSGLYVKGTGEIVSPPPASSPEDDYEFCCLGMLTNLYHEEKGTAFQKRHFNRGVHPNVVAKWAGLDNCGFETENLCNMNDGTYGKKLTFKGIANWIEKNL